MEWTEELLRDYRAYSGHDPFVPQSVTREVLSAYPYESWTLAEFRRLLDSVPAEFQDTATIELEGGWDESSSLKIRYADVQSAQEMQASVERFMEYREERAVREKAEYDRLKKKFGTSAAPMR